MWNDLVSAISIGYRNNEGSISPYVRFDKYGVFGDEEPIRFFEKVQFDKSVEMLGTVNNIFLKDYEYDGMPKLNSLKVILNRIAGQISALQTRVTNLENKQE